MVPNQAPADDGVFAAVVEFLRSELDRKQFQMWFGSMEPVRVDDDGGLVFSVSNSFVRDWIDTYYGEVLKRAVSTVRGGPARIELQVRAGTPAPKQPRPPQQQQQQRKEPPPQQPPPPVTLPEQQQPPPHRPLRSKRRTSGPAPRRQYEERFQLFGHSRFRNFRSDVILNEDYRFENFVVGPSNHLPQAAAMAVASAPGNAYNPLFLHGSVGLGKTHLLQGICQKVLAKRPDARILYLSCETFVNQFIAAVEAGELADFRYRYRHVDMLLIDDIHFLARKERTQEEFFHTFNTLYNSRKQIILSCDSPPREIPTLEDRLVSRFKWGLVAEIEAPDHETRISIVRRKAERRGIELDEEIAALVADNITNNVRELEGAVLRVIGYASLTNRPLSLELATEALRDVIQPKERKVSIESILRVVCEHFGVKQSDIVGKRRHKSISLPRQVCMYLARRLTDYSLVEIGGQIGGRDHTTVIYANEKIARQLETNVRLREDLEIVVKRIRSGG